MVGIAESNMEKYNTGENNDPHLTGGTAWYVNGGAGYFDGSSVSASSFSSSTSYTNGDIIGLALDMDSGTQTIKFYKNGSLVNTTNLNANFNEHIVFASNMYSTTAGIWNFGQDGSFAGILTGGDVGTETDGNGLGKFKYSVPSGYLSLCSSNLDDDDFASIGPSKGSQADDHFNTLLYTGNGSASRGVTGVGFKPDWLWVKSRSATYYYGLWDSARTNKSALYTNATQAEDTSTAGTLGSLDADGFTTPNVSGGGFININSATYVAWNWKANGGTATLTNDASATGVGSIDSVCQANTTAGFSIVTYTGDSTGNDGTASTVAHGLGAVPKWIYFLPRDSNDGAVYHAGNTSAPETDTLILKSDSSTGQATFDGSGFFNDTLPTSAVFSIGSRKHTNSNGGMVAYCFAEIEGYSKFGSYTAKAGSGSTPNNDGVFVYLGFRPAWIMIKYTGSGSWNIHDSKRSTMNAMQNFLLATNVVEQTNEAIDFLSNGVKMRSASGYFDHPADGSFIYMAFAEAPFKYSNAR